MNHILHIHPAQMGHWRRLRSVTGCRTYHEGKTLYQGWD